MPRLMDMRQPQDRLMPPPMPGQARTGFTIMELVVVISVLAIVVTTLVSSSNLVQRMPLDESTRIIESQHRRAIHWAQIERSAEFMYGIQIRAVATPGKPGDRTWVVEVIRAKIRQASTLATLDTELNNAEIIESAELNSGLGVAVDLGQSATGNLTEDSSAKYAWFYENGSGTMIQWLNFNSGGWLPAAVKASMVDGWYPADVAVPTQGAKDPWLQSGIGQINGAGVITTAMKVNTSMSYGGSVSSSTVVYSDPQNYSPLRVVDPYRPPKLSGYILAASSGWAGWVPSYCSQIGIQAEDPSFRQLISLHQDGTFISRRVHATVP